MYLISWAKVEVEEEKNNIVLATERMDKKEEYERKVCEKSYNCSWRGIFDKFIYCD